MAILLKEADKFGTQEAMRDIYKRLSEMGIKASFVRNCILPDWWEDRLAVIPANRAYAEAVIARQFGLEIRSLRDKDAKLEKRQNASLKLKTRQGMTNDDLQVAIMLGERLARIVSISTDTPSTLDDLTASSIRERILDSDVPWVGFDELLNFCWEIGVPVVNLCKIPTGNKKPDGIALWIDERPVIVISSGKKQPAWHLFILAHELGHIVCGHLTKGQVGVDSEVRLKALDAEEEEANAFAVELLSGDPNLSFSPPPRQLNAKELACAAHSIGSKLRIDPGFIALSYSRSQNFIPVGTAALNELNPNADVCRLYQSTYDHLKLDELTEDNHHVFESLTEAA